MPLRRGGASLPGPLASMSSGVCGWRVTLPMSDLETSLRSRAQRRGPRPLGMLGLYAARLRNPLFLNLRFRFAGVDGSRVFPQNLPHLYRDSPLLLFGRYVPGKSAKISLQVLGDSLHGTKELLVQMPIPEKPTGPDTIAATWARQKIYDLLSRMTDSRDGQGRILDEVRTLADEYKVETPYF